MEGKFKVCVLDFKFLKKKKKLALRLKRNK